MHNAAALAPKLARIHTVSSVFFYIILFYIIFKLNYHINDHERL